MKMNLREALHMVEFRTMPQGHPDYRLICQEMWRKIQQVHPALAEAEKFIDWQKSRLGRLQSEMRTEFKKSAMEKINNFSDHVGIAKPSHAMTPGLANSDPMSRRLRLMLATGLDGGSSMPSDNYLLSPLVLNWRRDSKLQAQGLEIAI